MEEGSKIEKQVTKKINKVDLASIAAMALLCAMFFAIHKTSVAREGTDEWLAEKKINIITCDPDGSTNDNKSGSKNEGNGCAHQAGTNSPCDITGKRKSLQRHIC